MTKLNIINRNDRYVKKHYEIYPNGRQFYTEIDNYGILISDFSVKILLYPFYAYEIDIKDCTTDGIVFMKLYRPFLFRPKLRDIEKKIYRILARLKEK